MIKYNAVIGGKMNKIQKRSLLKEIGFILCIKVACIYILWGICFAHPLEKTLTPTKMTTHLFSK